MANLSDEHLRDLIIRAHGMATTNYVQSDTEMRRRIGVMLDEAIKLDDTMRAFLRHTENGHAAPGSLSREDGRIDCSTQIGGKCDCGNHETP